MIGEFITEYGETHTLNGLPHKEDGPAIIIYHKDGTIDVEIYCINNEYHREDGPAVIYYNKDGSIKSQYYYLRDQAFYDSVITDNWIDFCKINIFF